MMCPDCGSDYYTFEDGSSLCSLCYVHGPEKAKKIMRQRVRQFASAFRNNEASALRRAFS